ncbi:hypothetical protein [Alteromonas halophila]|uniref:Uncharacterized protein n=1 Tax=Alteromonas halophila TaxID=516698 RepID=A0A918JD69_9ALTE|nr:hypothetical protein [Alteromonas halophila]GGW75247.1 hypothetical protein GCM10007391_04350 [Alteromonas halophila]
MDVSSATAAPVSTTLDPAPPRDNRALSSPQGDTQSAPSAQVDGTQSSDSTQDPNARIGGQIDTYV